MYVSVCVCVYARIENPLILLFTQSITNVCDYAIRILDILPFRIYIKYIREVGIWLQFYLCYECHWRDDSYNSPFVLCEVWVSGNLYASNELCVCLFLSQRERCSSFVYEAIFIFLRFYNYCLYCVYMPFKCHMCKIYETKITTKE